MSWQKQIISGRIALAVDSTLTHVREPDVAGKLPKRRFVLCLRSCMPLATQRDKRNKVCFPRTEQEAKQSASQGS